VFVDRLDQVGASAALEGATGYVGSDVGVFGVAEGDAGVSEHGEVEGPRPAGALGPQVVRRADLVGDLGVGHAGDLAEVADCLGSAAGDVGVAEGFSTWRVTRRGGVVGELPGAS
jgi:hypothetical protein